MSVFADRRSFRQIGGPRAYLRQVAWSLWWRLHLRSHRPAAAPSAAGLATRPADTRNRGERAARPF